jgi:hypothetical protein
LLSITRVDKAFGFERYENAFNVSLACLEVLRRGIWNFFRYGPISLLLPISALSTLFFSITSIFEIIIIPSESGKLHQLRLGIDDGQVTAISYCDWKR